MTEKHGGSRHGAGRKTEKSGKLERRNLMLDRKTIRLFERAGNGNISLGARRAAKKIVEIGCSLDVDSED